MSNQIQYDPLLVRHLARELDGVLRDRACAALPLFDSDLSATLPLDGGEALRLDLHPTRGWVRLIPWAADADALDSWCLGVSAPADERLLRVRLRSGDRFSAADRLLTVELHTNQWNALVVAEEDGRVLTALRSRQAGERAIRPGQPYRPPAPRPRYGAEPVPEEEAWARWRHAWAETPPERRAAAIVRGFAGTGTLSAAALAALPEREAFQRWWRMWRGEGAHPVLLQVGARRQPYPFPLPGLPAEPVQTLLAAMARVAAEPPLPRDEALERERRRAQARRRRDAAARRVDRLEGQLARVGEGERLRGYGDLLLAKKRTVPRGASRVRLRGWDGKDVDIELDPTLGPADNAIRYYQEAKRLARAEEQLPRLLEEALAEWERWDAAVAAAEEGELPGWAEAELERAERLAVSAPKAGEAAVALPFRTYRTSGGLEVRVGRSSRDNDRLTFAHSAPNDVWLHARSVPGSHVILRWPDAEAAPPARDLGEAAGLAALFSKARSSALVPVDWTRRKHVRKPRGAPPGSVVPQRVKTLFVEPDAALEERLRTA